MNPTDNMLSVIVSSYNNEDFLYETIDSILGQNYDKIELIICDDSTPDFNEESVREYIDSNKKENVISYKIIHNKSNIGTVKNINNGILASNGSLIKIISGDDTYPKPDVFKNQINYLNAHEDIDIVIGIARECDEKMNILKEPDSSFIDTVSNLSQPQLLRYLCKYNTNVFCTQAMCFRRSFLFQAGLYDESFRLIEDLPMQIKIASSGTKYGFIKKICVNHRRSIGISANTELFDISKIQYYADLELYYKKTLARHAKTIGPLFVYMRGKVCEFRIAFCQHKGERIKQIGLIIKYFVPLLYYVLTNPGAFLRKVTMNSQ